MGISNYMEVAVYEMMDDILEELEVCDCAVCRDDIAAIALNNLEPKYFASNRGEMFTRVNQLINQFGVDITKEVTKASEIVNKNKRHP